MENNNLICEIDKSVHVDRDALHGHLRKFKIKQSDYYETYHPRFDKLTTEKIQFKSIDQYFAAHFLNKINARRWFKENPEEAKALAVEMLRERVLRKKLTTLPGEVELVSCGLPNSQYYYTKIGTKELSKTLGILSNFEYKLTKVSAPKDMVLDIIVDTREQQPLIIKGHNLVSKKLEFGDYALTGKENEVAIERKSLPDFISSFVTNYERVRKEFQRAKDAGAYMVVLCEESLNTALNYPYIPYFRKYTKIRPEAVFHNVRDAIQEFGIQFLFCDGRVRSAEVLVKLLSIGQTIKCIDLQWAEDHSKIL